MVMTGEADLRTPIGQSEEYYRALKMLKKETLLVRMPEEYHGWRTAVPPAAPGPLSHGLV